MVYVCSEASLRGEKVSATQLVPTSIRAESVNSELSSMLPGIAFMQTMWAVDGLTKNLCLTLLVYRSHETERGREGERVERLKCYRKELSLYPKNAKCVGNI